MYLNTHRVNQSQRRLKIERLQDPILFFITTVGLFLKKKKKKQEHLKGLLKNLPLRLFKFQINIGYIIIEKSKVYNKQSFLEKVFKLLKNI